MSHKCQRLTVATLGVLISTTAALADSGTYYPLPAGNLAMTGVSADGTIACGSIPLGQYYIWRLSDPTVVTPIGGFANAGTAQLSADGDRMSGQLGGFIALPPIPTTVVNQMAVYDVSENAWTGVGGINWYSGTDTSSGWSVSGDGNTLVGLGWSPNMTNAYAIKSVNTAGVWSAPVAMPWLVPGRSTRANGCSSNGNTLVGWQDNPAGYRQGAIWVNGIGQRLWHQYPRRPLGEASACSGDGTWVVGAGGYGTDDQAWRWSLATGSQWLGDLVTTAGWRGAATDITADGSIIIGYERPSGPAAGGQGWIWTEAGGMQNLTIWVQSQGVVFPTGVTTLALPLAISDDGKTIVGIANNGTNFVVRLPTAALAGGGPSSCAADVTGDGTVDTSDLLAVVTSWGACSDPANCPADVNNDGQVNTSDLTLVIGAWGPCD